MGTAVIADIDEDELFDLDIALLDGHVHCSQTVHSSTAVEAAAGHALLANCLLPVRSVSNAVPVVAASSVLSSSSSYPYSGYYSSRRLLFTGGGGGGSSRRFLGRLGGGSSARLCFSSRGFETMGNYFQRY
nr:unnamed protein product [Digitaria exilis]